MTNAQAEVTELQSQSQSESKSNIKCNRGTNRVVQWMRQVHARWVRERERKRERDARHEMKWQGKARQDTTRHDTTRATAADQATRRQAAAVRNESECRSQRRSQRCRRRRRCGRDHSLWSSPRGALQFKLHLKNCDASQRPHDQRQVSAPVCSYLLPPLHSFLLSSPFV